MGVKLEDRERDWKRTNKETRDGTGWDGIEIKGMDLGLRARAHIEMRVSGNG